MANDLDALHLSSDAVRLSLSHTKRRSGDRVFAELHRRFQEALAQRRSVVLDSTGMSPRFRALLHAYRGRVVHVHLLLLGERRFEERERSRADRPAGALPLAAFYRSQAIEFFEAPDLALATDRLTCEQVHQTVRVHLRFAKTVLY